MTEILTTAAPVAMKPPVTVAETRTVKAVKWWAVIGACFVALQAYIYIAWFVTGNAVTTPTGPDELPTWMRWCVYFQEIFSPLVAAACVYHFIIRPWRRERRLTLDGMLIISFALLVWQDPLLNYWAPTVTDNAAFANLGSWSANIPGWSAPNGNLYVEPLIWVCSAYVGFMFLGVVVISAIMRRAKARWPHLGKVGVVLVAFGAALVFDIVAETIWLRTGMYSYPGAIRSLSLFPGKYYQLPLYESVLYVATWTAWACLRHFRDDKGETMAERGIDDVRGTPRQKTSLRLLAIVGACNVIYLVGFALPWGWFALHADPWPDDVLKRSYLTNGMCGPGTRYACPGPGRPNNRPESWHLDPEGGLVEHGEDGYRPDDEGR